MIPTAGWFTPLRNNYDIKIWILYNVTLDNLNHKLFIKKKRVASEEDRTMMMKAEISSTV